MRHTEELWNNNKSCNICIIGIIEEEKEIKEQKKIAEEINENFCKLVSVVKLQNQETQNMLIRMNPQIKCTSA
jgi:hypothetical protein